MNKYKDVFQRTEMKYLLSPEQYKKLMPYLAELAEIDSYGDTAINNIYFDTPDFFLIRNSLEKPKYKEKLRLRTYGRTDDETNAFAEIKKKYDGIVYKRRISGSYKELLNYLIGVDDTVEDSQIKREIDAMKHLYPSLRPAMKITYDRFAMIGKDDPDLRITFDRNIRWSTDRLDLRDETSGASLLGYGEYLMEIKVAAAMPIELAGILSELSIFETSFSKFGKGYLEMQSRRAAVIAAATRARMKFGKGVVAYA